MVAKALCLQKAILTIHSQSLSPWNQPLPVLLRATKRQDQCKGFSIPFVSENGAVHCTEVNGMITDLKLVEMPALLKKAGVSTDIGICIQDQRQRQFLIDRCKPPSARGKQGMPHDK